MEKVYCPCGKEMVKDDEHTGGWKCPDKECWIIVDKEKVWVGKPYDKLAP